MHSEVGMAKAAEYLWSPYSPCPRRPWLLPGENSEVLSAPPHIPERCSTSELGETVRTGATAGIDLVRER